MNPLTHAAADSLTQGLWMGVMTAIFLVFFTGWTVWAWWPSNRDAMDEAARMPLDDGDPR